MRFLSASSVTLNTWFWELAVKALSRICRGFSLFLCPSLWSSPQGHNSVNFCPGLGRKISKNVMWNSSQPLISISERFLSIVLWHLKLCSTARHIISSVGWWKIVSVESEKRNGHRPLGLRSSWIKDSSQLERVVKPYRFLNSSAMASSKRQYKHILYVAKVQWEEIVWLNYHKSHGLLPTLIFPSPLQLVL